MIVYLMKVQLWSTVNVSLTSPFTDKQYTDNPIYIYIYSYLLYCSLALN